MTSSVKSGKIPGQRAMTYSLKEEPCEHPPWQREGKAHPLGEGATSLTRKIQEGKSSLGGIKGKNPSLIRRTQSGVSNPHHR